MIIISDFDGVLFKSLDELVKLNYTIFKNTYEDHKISFKKYQKIFKKYKYLVGPASEYLILNSVIKKYENNQNINFLDEFKKMTNTGEIKTTHSSHIPTKNYNISGKAFYRDPVIASLDGNTVELSVEQMQFAENTMKYQTTLKFLNGKITKMISAIRGE